MSVNTKGSLASAGNSEDELPSIPLYLAGLAATLSGIVAVTQYVADQNLTVTTLLLTIIGFVFSFGCRYLRVHLHIAEILIAGTALYAVYGVVSGNLDWHSVATRSQQDVAVVFAWALTIWSWAVISDGLVLMCALLSMASIGLLASIDLDGQVELCFMTLWISTLFLIGQHLYHAKRAQASSVERERAAGRLWLVQMTVVTVAALVVFAVGSAVVVPAQMIFRGASLLQALRGLVALSPQNKVPGATGPYVSDDSDFEIGTGQGFGATSDVVAFVSPSDKLPHYWKARTYDEYTGAGWMSSADGEYQPVQGRLGPGGSTSYTVDAGNAADTGRPVTTLIDNRSITHELFYTGTLTQLTVRRIAPSIDVCPDGHVSFADNSLIRSAYLTVSTVEPDPESPEWAQRLRSSGTQFPPDVRQAYTGVQNQITTYDDIDYFRRTVKQVTASLPANRRSELDIVEALKSYVSHQAVYSLDVAPLPAQTDHVRAFLQDTRVGYCDMFASSLAVLCRVAGYPSRVVTGFAPGSYDGIRYTLRAMDKHAWTEVFFPSYGWVTFDATSGSATSSTASASNSTAASLLSRVRAFLTARGPVAPILLAVIAAILLYIVKIEFIDRLRHRAMATTDEPVSKERMGKQYERLVRSVGGLGLRRRRSETPDEFAGRASRYLRNLEGSLGVSLSPEFVTDFTREYTVVRYGGDRYRRASRRDIDPEMAMFLRKARRARVKFVLRRLRRWKPPVA